MPQLVMLLIGGETPQSLATALLDLPSPTARHAFGFSFVQPNEIQLKDREAFLWRTRGQTSFLPATEDMRKSERCDLD